MRIIRIDCDTPTCHNFQVLVTDSPLPKHWVCSPCADHIEQQHIEALAQADERFRAAVAHVHPIFQPILNAIAPRR